MTRGTTLKRNSVFWLLEYSSAAHTEASWWRVGQGQMPSKETNVHAELQGSLLENSCQLSTGALLLLSSTFCCLFL